MTSKNLLLVVLIMALIVPTVSAFQWCEIIPFWDCPENVAGNSISKNPLWVLDYTDGIQAEYFNTTIENQANGKAKICLIPKVDLKINDPIIKDSRATVRKNNVGTRIVEPADMETESAAGNIIKLCVDVDKNNEDYIKFGSNSTVIVFEEEILEVKDINNDTIADVTLTTDGYVYRNGKPHVDVTYGIPLIIHSFQIDKNQTYDDIIENVYFVDMKTNTTISKNFTLKYLQLNEREQDRYGCTTNATWGNGTNYCIGWGLIGTYNLTHQDWIDLNSTYLNSQDSLTVGIEIVPIKDEYVDVGFDFAGMDIGIFWASWSANLNASLVSYYRMDESSGTIVYDELANNTGSMVSTNLNTDGKINLSHNFPSGSEYDTFGHMGSMGSELDDKNWSISLWYNSNSTTSCYGFGTVNTGSQQIAMGFHKNSGEGAATGNIFLALRAPSTVWLSGGINSDIGFYDGAWHHFVFRFQGADGKLSIMYDNVTQAFTYANSNTLSGMTDLTHNFTIGARNVRGSVSGNCIGSYDEVAIYERYLDNVSVSELYEAPPYNGGTSPVDNPPTIELNNPIDVYNTTNTTINFNCTGQDDLNLTTIKLYLDDSLNQTNSSVLNNSLTNFEVTGLSPGTHNWTCEATDNSSQSVNATARTFNISGFVDNPPTIELNNPINAYNTTETTLNFNCTGQDDLNLTNVSLYVDGLLNQTNVTPFNNSLTNFEVNGLTSGAHNWTCEVTDNSSQSTSASVRTLNIGADNPPVVTHLEPSPDSGSPAPPNEYQNNVSFICNVYDDYGIANVTLDLYILYANSSYAFLGSQVNTSVINNTNLNFTFYDLPRGQGSYVWACNAVDTNSQVTNPTNWSWYVPAEPPVTVMSFDPPSPVTYPTPVNVTCNTTSNGVVELLRDGVDVTGELNTDVLLTNGTYQYQCRINETLYYTASTNNQSFVVGLSYPQITLGSGSPEGNYSLSPITLGLNFDVYGANNISNVSLYISDILNETNSSGVNNTNYNFSKTFTDGSYGYYGIVYDIFGLSNQTIVYNFSVDGTSPEVNITYPEPGYVVYNAEETIQLNWTVSDTHLNACWYNYGETCFQESASVDNQTGLDGDCGLNYSGDYFTSNNWNPAFSNIYDGDYLTYSRGATGQASFYVNYTIPANATTESIWRIKTESGYHNVTLDSTCYDYPGNKLKLQILSGWLPLYDVLIYCYNSSEVPILLLTVDGNVANDVNLYEEAMFWDISNSLVCSDNSTTFNYPASNPPSLTVYLYANDTYGNVGNDSVTLTISEIIPVLNITYPPENYSVTAYNQSINLNWTLETNGTTDSCWYNTSEGSTPVYVTCGDNVTTFNYPVSNPDNLTVTLYANDTLGNEANDSVTMILSTSAPQITLTSPLTSYATLNNGDSVDLNWTIVNATELDTCWYNYNNINTTVTCGDGTDTFVYVSGSDNLTFYVNDTLSNFNSTSVSWIVYAGLDDVIYDTEVIETDTMTIKGVFTITSNVTSVTGNLVYDGINYTATPVITGNQANLTATLDVPVYYADKNVSFNFDLTVTTGSGTETASTSDYYQYVNNFTISECRTDPTGEIVNYTTRVAITPFSELDTTFRSTWYYYVSTGTGNTIKNVSYEELTETNSTQRFCLNLWNETAIVSNQVQADATGYAAADNFLVAAELTTNVTEQTLYLLNDSLADATVLQVYDQSGFPLGDILINVQYFDLGTNSYITVTQALTSSIGSDVVYLNWLDSLYKFVLVQDGETVQTTLPENIYESPRIFTIGEDTIFTFLEFQGIDYNLYYNSGTENFVLTFAKPDGKFSQGCLRVNKKSASSDTLICDTCSVAASATLLCDVSAYGNGTYVATFYGIGSPAQGIDWIIEIIGETFSVHISDALGAEDSTFYAFMLGILIVGVMFVSPVFGILGIIIALFISNILGFVLIDYITFVGIALTGGIVAWLIKG